MAKKTGPAEPDLSQAVLEADGRAMEVPEAFVRKDGAPPQRFEFEGGLYEHVSEDEAGRWVYRRWN